MRPFSLLVKPASADCNLRCDYCFYLEKARLYPETKRHRMSDAVLERLIRSYLATEQGVHALAWQGGEPTLMGLEFFRRVTALQAKYRRPGGVVANTLQTNATLIDDEMAEHLARHRFLVGCSLDGPPDVHDRFRRSAAGGPSHADVMRGIRTLQRREVEFNILVLVSRANMDRAAEVYRYLVDQGFLFHQYIPCVEFDERGRPEPYTITGEAWGEFLCSLFDAWHARDTHTVSIRNFDAILNKLVDDQSTVCTMADDCRQYFVVEHNGDVYPCDFFVEPELKLGNIARDGWEALQDSEVYRAFGLQKRQRHPSCQTCAQLDLCFGDCLKHRMYARHPAHTRSWLCSGIKRFLEEKRGRFASLAGEVRWGRAGLSLGGEAIPAPGETWTLGHGETPC